MQNHISKMHSSQKISSCFSANILLLFLLFLPMTFSIASPNEDSQMFLKVAIMDTYPWGFLDQKKNPSGIYYDFARRIIEESGFSAEYMIVPYNRAIAYIERGEADITMMYSNERLENAATNLATIALFENAILGKMGSHYTSLEELHGKVVGRLSGAKYSSKLESDSAIIKFDVDNYRQAIMMLMEKRLDAIIGVKEGFYFNAKELGYERDRFGNPFVLNRKPFILHLSRRSSDVDIVSERLGKSIEILKSRNEFQAILKLWFQED